VNQHEVPCVDCGADIIADVDDDEPRCDTCSDHHNGLCGADCPIFHEGDVCQWCENKPDPSCLVCRGERLNMDKETATKRILKALLAPSGLQPGALTDAQEDKLGEASDAYKRKDYEEMETILKELDL